MSAYLFNEFDAISLKQWKQKIQVDLKGADYNETLVWESNESIKVKPFYHQDDYEALRIPTPEGKTAICQSIFISNEQTAGFLAKDALNRGATAIQFEANAPFDIEALLQYITQNTAATSFFFKLSFLSESFFSDIIAKTKGKTVFLNIDPLGNLARSGNWFSDKRADFQTLKNIFQKAPENVNTLGIDVGLYQNAGANGVQQIAYALAHANEYLNFFDNESIIAKSNAATFQFNFAVSSNYFFEIAKLRAFRYLWKLLSEAYKINSRSHVFVTPSLRNKTLYDYNTNMLRTTTECMSALLGGANTVSNIAYDAIYHKKNEFGERIARNQLLILQDESYFKEASKFVEGAYYIESLTKQLAEKALTLFKDIERSGGFLKQLLDGTIQRKIAESASKEQEQFAQGQEILLGTNKHPNANDKMKEELELHPFIKMQPRKTAIHPIIPKRLAEKLEKERLEKE